MTSKKRSSLTDKPSTINPLKAISLDHLILSTKHSSEPSFVSKSIQTGATSDSHQPVGLKRFWIPSKRISLNKNPSITRLLSNDIKFLRPTKTSKNLEIFSPITIRIKQISSSNHNSRSSNSFEKISIRPKFNPHRIQTAKLSRRSNEYHPRRRLKII